MKIDLEWSADGDGRSWRKIWSASGSEVGRIECGNGGYRYVVNGTVGAWQDRLWEAIAGFKEPNKGEKCDETTG